MTEYQKYYWKDPDHCRELQRAKYVRYPDRIKAANRVWQEKNRDYFRKLVSFATRLHYERTHLNRPEKVASIVAMRERFKSRYRRNAGK
jgi:hypothetical protein